MLLYSAAPRKPIYPYLLESFWFCSRPGPKSLEEGQGFQRFVAWKELMNCLGSLIYLIIRDMGAVSCTAGKSFIVLKADAYRGYSGHMVFSFTHFAVQHLKHNSSTMYHACLVSFRDGDNANDADT